MLGENYCNLDHGLTNHFFETKFSFSKDRYKSCIGPRVNFAEDIILLNGQRILKETYVEIETVMMFKNDISCINAKNIIIDRCRFQVEGSTTIHLYALNYTQLKLVLDFYDQVKRNYLTSILVRNN